MSVCKETLIDFGFIAGKKILSNVTGDAASPFALDSETGCSLVLLVLEDEIGITVVFRTHCSQCFVALPLLQGDGLIVREIEKRKYIVFELTSLQHIIGQRDSLEALANGGV